MLYTIRGGRDMRPYIIINGVPSTRIEGLLISTLTSISKPELRTNTETIDGRDGDLITPLGYSAYDKTITIGLTKDYDVDEVISYFNSEGKITFSNEPDKYYNFTIIDAIDFEKLIRFKTATVTLHVQPFKYSALETKQTFNYSLADSGSVTVTNSGNYFSKPIITLTGSGITNISINDTQLLIVDLGTERSTIAIDVNSLNAYDPNTMVFKNRQVKGEYESCTLKVGSNTISFSGGAIDSISIDNYSRWL